MNHVSTMNSVWAILAGIALACVAWVFLAWARRKGKARVFWMSTVGPGVMFGGVGIAILGLVSIIRGP